MRGRGKRETRQHPDKDLRNGDNRFEREKAVKNPSYSINFWQWKRSECHKFRRRQEGILLVGESMLHLPPSQYLFFHHFIFVYLHP
jgi:hypothetical protein